MSEINIQDALLQLGGSVKLYKTLIKGFLDKYPGIGNEIKTALLNNEFEEARRIAHTMKGLSGNLGANRLHLKAKNLENSIIDINSGEGDESITDILTAGLRMFNKELKEVLVELEIIMGTPNEMLKDIKSSRELRQDLSDSQENLSAAELDEYKDDLLSGLLTSLNTYNYVDITKIVQRIDANYSTNNRIKGWKLIKELIYEYEYDQAKEMVMEGVDHEK